MKPLGKESNRKLRIPRRAMNRPITGRFVRQQEYRAGEITREEYFEWKLNWPDTCDDLGKVTPMIQWRKKK